MAAIVIAPKEVAAPVAKKDVPTNVSYNPTWVPKGKDGKENKNATPMPTVAVGPLGSEVQGLAGGIPKWKRLFGKDKDGDSVLAEMFKILLLNCATDAEKEALIGNLGDAIEAIKAHLGME